jgi:hypothetical protein
LRRACLFTLLALPTAAPLQAEQQGQVFITLTRSPGQQGQPGGITIQTPQDPRALFRISPSTANVPATLSFFVAVVDQFGRIVPNSDITIVYDPVANSGGHQHHDASRPKGQYEPESGNTGPDGYLPVTYTAPEASGLIFSVFTCHTPSGGPCSPSIGNVDVSIDLEAANCGNQVGQTATHPTNNYALPSLQAACSSALDDYTARYPGSTLTYNDMSLPWGGLFDIDATWAPPHGGHRWGENADFEHDFVPVSRRRVLRQIIRNAGFSIFDEGDHWHLTVLG